MNSKGKEKAAALKPLKLSQSDLDITQADPKWEQAVACIRTYQAQAPSLSRPQQEELREYILNHGYVVQPSCASASSHKLYKTTMREIEKRGEDIANVSWPIFLILSTVYTRLPKEYVKLVRRLHGTTHISDQTSEYLDAVKETIIVFSSSTSVFSTPIKSEAAENNQDDPVIATTKKWITQARETMAKRTIDDQMTPGSAPRDGGDNTVYVESSDEEPEAKVSNPEWFTPVKRPAPSATPETESFSATKRQRQSSVEKGFDIAKVARNIESSILARVRCEADLEKARNDINTLQTMVNNLQKTFDDLAMMFRSQQTELQLFIAESLNAEYTPSESDASEI